MKRLMILGVLLFLVHIMYGGDIARKGTTGAEQLLIPVGARSIATSGAFHATVTGTEAIYYNPAGAAGSNFNESMFSYLSYFADINISYFALTMNVGEVGTIGISTKSFNFGQIPVTTVTNPDGTGATYSPSFSVFGVTYAKEITERVRAGVNAKLIHEGIMSTSANGFAFDFGVQYKFNSDFYIGVSLKNLGGDMAYEGQDLQTKISIPNTTFYDKLKNTGLYSPIIESFQLPSYFEFSLSYNIPTENFDIALGSTFHNFGSYEDAIDFGTEIKIIDLVFLRAGYNYLLENQKDNQYGLSYGAGFEYGTEGFKVGFDYAFRSAKDFVGNNVITVRIKF